MKTSIEKLLFIFAILALYAYAEDTNNIEEYDDNNTNMPMSVISYVPKKNIDLKPQTPNSITLKDISKEEFKSADFAESLAKNYPSVSLIRRSGIANDIILRGQKRDNINVLIDESKIHGACPNRMDPPTSHILTNNIEDVEITEGPYDIENFGTLSGIIKVKTKSPKEKFNAEVNLNAGSFGYKKISATASGGTDRIKILASVSKEESEQYKDGNGDTFAEQLNKYTTSNSNYQAKYKDLKAYEKTTVMSKLFVNITNNQELKIGHTENRSDNVLYPSSKMDALYDDSDINDAGYTVRELGTFSKKLDFEYFDSKVEHPMSTKYRESALNVMMGEMTSALTSNINGAKIKNSFEIGNTEVLIGLDSNTRNWDGDYYKNGVDLNKKSISDVDTLNNALFVKTNNKINSIDFNFGARVDSTKIKPNEGVQQENDYQSLNLNIFAIFNTDGGINYFAGIGKASRVPDARELYFLSSQGVEVGTPNLKQSTNSEIDLGFEKKYDNGSFKTKFFYSKLDNYIYYNASKSANNFENIGAKIYGATLNGSFLLNNKIYFDYGMAYQEGIKDKAINGQKDKDLAEIAPLKTNLLTNYIHNKNTNIQLEIIASEKWAKYDEDNGEQEIDSYIVTNIKFVKKFQSKFELAVGIDNILDKTYAVSNTYQDLTLINDNPKIMLLNEQGRYLYTNLNYRF
ncbi:MAG: iron complex outerrane recepter protein [Campylobacterota bacterium]|nr:iron complex outerrane recepter protein [Campylobacterota bacterium]